MRARVRVLVAGLAPAALLVAGVAAGSPAHVAEVDSHLTVGPEHAVSEVVTGAAAAGDQVEPAIAFDGTNHLLVWTDRRPGGTHDIYGVRVGPDGAPIDAAAFPISTAAAAERSPDVAFDGTGFLVVWHDSRGSSIDVYGARVTTAGEVLDPGGIPLTTAPGNQMRPAVAFDGASFLVVWEDWSLGPADLKGTRVSAAGSVLDPTPITVASATGAQDEPAVASDGTTALVVWSDARSETEVWGARLGQDGAVLADPARISPAGSAARPSLAFDGTNYLVAWSTPGVGDVRGARVDASGTVLDADGLAIGTAPGDQREPEASFDGTNFLIVWKHQLGDVAGRRVSPAGVMLDPGPVTYASEVGNDSLAVVEGGAGSSLVAWSQRDDGFVIDIVGMSVGGDGAPEAPASVLSRAANDQAGLSVAFDGTNYLVVWEDDRSEDGSDVYAARLTPEGVSLDGAGIPVSTAPGHQRSPAVAFDGTNYLVVWEDGRDGFGSDLYAARVDPAGTVIDPDGIAISTEIFDQSNPDVTFDGANFVVVWSDWRDTEWDVYGARVTPAGTVLEPEGIAISTAAGPQVSPSVAAGATNLLVVWADDRTNHTMNVFGARLSKGGALLNASGFPISTAADDQGAPSVVFAGTEYFVAWSDHRPAAGSDAYGARVTPAGVVRDPAGIPISTGPANVWETVVGFDGANLVVVWTRESGGHTDVRAARVTPAGTVLDPSGVTVAGSTSLERDPALAAVLSGRVAVAYRRFLTEAPFSGVHRAVLRFVSRPPGPASPRLLSGPSGHVRSRSATFTFAALQEDVTLECRLDGGAFAACASPLAYTGLAQGAHTFRVRAKDGEGLTSAVLARTWTVDTVAPRTRIVKRPKATTRLRTATFGFKSSEAGSKFQCKLDKKPWAACKPPRTYRKLKPGRHVFQVRATDKAGNRDATPAKVAWKINR